MKLKHSHYSILSILLINLTIDIKPCATITNSAREQSVLMTIGLDHRALQNYGLPEGSSPLPILLVIESLRYIAEENSTNPHCQDSYNPNSYD